MQHVGVREVKDRVSEILRQVEQGQSFVVTVHGREVADITPHQAPNWTTWDTVSAALNLPADLDLLADLDSAGGVELANPWDQE
ncbi:MAG: type II toxin-antitoxin system prevent-host-death family antitoxin [Actinomycetes bacterium]